MLSVRLAFYITACWHLLAICLADGEERKTGVMTKINPLIDPFILQTGGCFIYLLRASTAYVDKTLFIKFILEHEKDVIWITLPTHWGKTANLKMLEAFLTPYIDDKGRTIPTSDTVSYKFFKQGQILSIRRRPTNYTSPPLISKHEDIMKEYLGKYPVIYVEFNNIGVRRNNWNEFFTDFRREVEYHFTTHCYLETYLEEKIHSQKTSPEEKKAAQENLDRFKLYLYHVNYTDEALIETSLLFLSQLLHERFRKPVVVLVDEFVRVVNVMFMYSNYEKDLENRIIKVLQNFLRHTITHNPFLKKAVLSGILPFAKELFFPNYTNIVHYSFMNSSDVLGYYGFLQYEVDALLEHFNIPPEQQREVIDYYKGFTLIPNSDVVVYQPYSFVRYIDWKKIDQFFRDSANLFPVRNWFAVEKFRKILRSMLNGTEITVKPPKFDLDQRIYVLPKAVDVWEKNNTVDEQGYDLIFTLLCHTGYLTLTNRTDVVTSPGEITLRIPSTELWLSINETLYWNYTIVRNRRTGLMYSTPC